LAYNKDLQEDKEGVFDSADTILPSLEIMTAMLKTMKVNKEIMEKSTQKDFSNATELADYLASKGLPFRQAHEIVGKLVLDCSKKGIYLQDVSISEYKALSDLIEIDIYKCLESKTAVARRVSLGGTGFDSVKAQIAQAKAQLADK
jgi:argininosuccinate lyase